MAWGLDGELYVTENQYDVHGSRSVFGTGDLLCRVIPGRWYGWPDHFAGARIHEDEWFAPPFENEVRERLLTSTQVERSE